MTPEEIAALITDEIDINNGTTTELPNWATPEPSPEKDDIQTICEEMGPVRFFPDRPEPKEVPESEPSTSSVDDALRLMALESRRGFGGTPSRIPIQTPQKITRQRTIKLIPEGRLQYVNKGSTAPRRAGQTAPTPPPPPSSSTAGTPISRTISEKRILDL